MDLPHNPDKGIDPIGAGLGVAVLLSPYLWIIVAVLCLIGGGVFIGWVYL